jgi:hypothetical protein
MQSTIRLCTIVLAGAALATATLGQAQSSSPPSSGLDPSIAHADISDRKLDAAAAAAQNAADIKESYDKKLAEAPMADKVRIAVEADKAMVKAVTDQGLTLDEFKAIMRLAQNDPAVRSRFVKRLQ